MGYVSANRMRDWGSTNGFFPVIRLSQLYHVSAHGGYARLVSLSQANTQRLVVEGDEDHDRWVGAEPLLTQWAREQAYVRTRYNKDLREAYVHHYAADVPYRARLRVPPQKVGKEQAKDIAKTGRNLRDYVYHQADKGDSN
jgi:hypothetical protein